MEMSGVRGYHVYQDVFTPSTGEKLVARLEFNNTMDKQAVKVVKGDETVGHLPHKFSRIVLYCLARSGEISVEVIGRWGCGRMEAPWQFEFNSSNKVKMKLLKELRVSKSWVQNRPEDCNKQLTKKPSKAMINNGFHYV